MGAFSTHINSTHAGGLVLRAATWSGELVEGEKECVDIVGEEKRSGRWANDLAAAALTRGDALERGEVRRWITTESHANVHDALATELVGNPARATQISSACGDHRTGVLVGF